MSNLKHARARHWSSGLIILLLAGLLAFPQSSAKASLQSLVNGDFEQGDGVGWQTWPPGTAGLVWNTAAHGGQPAPAHSGTWMANLGGANDQSFQLYQTVTFGDNKYMSFWYWIDTTESFCGRDSGWIWVNSHAVQILTLCTSWNTGGWVQAIYDISPYVSPGQTGDIIFELSTDRTDPSRWLIDDVTFHKTFADISNTHPFAPYIEALYQAGITSGCSTNPSVYCPDAFVTRGQMAVFLERAMGNSSPNPSPNGMFTDIPPAHPFKPFIEELYNDGVTSGCSTSPLTYCPDSPVTRGQMAVFIERALGNFSPNPTTAGIFIDVPPSHPFAPYIAQLFNDGITSGCSTSPMMYCPDSPVTRGQMAVFIAKAFSLPLP
jgi:S-layer homology domain